MAMLAFVPTVFGVPTHSVDQGVLVGIREGK